MEIMFQNVQKYNKLMNGVWNGIISIRFDINNQVEFFLLRCF